MKSTASKRKWQQCAILLFVCSLALLSCHARTTLNDEQQTANYVSTPITNLKKGIRSVDFKNFPYPWYPSFLKPPAGKSQVMLSEGKFEIERDERQGFDNLALELQDVSYVELIGGDEEQAIVTVGGISVFNRFVDCIFIYAIKGNTPVLLWKHETGDRADGGLRRVVVESGNLMLEEYARSEGDGGLCCPKIFIRSNYKWSGTQFEKISSATFPNEYKTAEFLGYAGSHP